MYLDIKKGRRNEKILISAIHFRTYSRKSEAYTGGLVYK